MRLACWTRRMLLVAALAASGCGARPGSRATDAAPALVGAWRSEVRFQSGAFASVRDLEFMYVFNLGGTMTESSNYDGAPPVPPAYGAWRVVGPGEFEARYEFYSTKPPGEFSEIVRGGGWMPSGRGVLVERIRLAPDGNSFTSTVRYEAHDPAGNLIEGGGAAVGRGTRIRP